jgi:hypothetical protein
MIIATVYLAFLLLPVGAIIVKTYEWHHDVLYGPYLNRID